MQATASTGRPDVARSWRPVALVLGGALLAGAGTAGATPEVVTPSVEATFDGGPLEVGGRDPGVVHLTFDDGPDQIFTPMLLDLLDDYGAKASFFPLGRNLESRWGGDEIQDLLSRGHAVGNHSLDHRRMSQMHPWAVAADLDTASTLIESLAGFRPSCFRAPYGDHDGLVDAVAASLGMVHAGWTADPQEWRDPWVPVVMAYLIGERHDGSVILLHDRKWLALHIAAEVMESFTADGWRFAALPACRSDSERRDRIATRGPGDVPVGLVERVWSSGGALHLTGWAFDADMAGGGLEILAATATGPVVAGVTSSGHDFNVVVDPEDAVGPICIWARNAGRERYDTSLGCHLPELDTAERR